MKRFGFTMLVHEHISLLTDLPLTLRLSEQLGAVLALVESTSRVFEEYFQSLHEEFRLELVLLVFELIQLEQVHLS